MTTIIRTRTPDGAELDWPTRSLPEPQAIATALEHAGPGAVVVRIWREGEW